MGKWSDGEVQENTLAILETLKILKYAEDGPSIHIDIVANFRLVKLTKAKPVACGENLRLPFCAFVSTSNTLEAHLHIAEESDAGNGFPLSPLKCSTQLD